MTNGSKTKPKKKKTKSDHKKAAKKAQKSAPDKKPAPVLACKCPAREVTSITVKRKHINLTADDKYGHWWLEIDGKESYGWWPKTGVGMKATLGGTTGELNGQTTFGGTKTRDPHHGDSAEDTFHPKTSTGDCRSDQEIHDCLRSFAKSYSGEWRWTFGAGQNCHTFQESAMKHCKLKK